MAAARLVTPEPLSASGLSSEKLSLPALQSKMKIDPEGYETELGLIYTQFDSALDLYQQQAALNFGSTTSSGGVCADPTVAKNLGDRAMFLAHMTPFYPKHLAKFPSQLAEFLKSSARSLPSGLRGQVTQALILLINRQAVEISETLELFMELQTLGDRNLRKLAFSHVIQSIKRMNKNHKNMTKNKALQNILFSTLQQEDEAQAKRALVTLCELHRRKVWFDDRTANAICTACFHSSSRIMISAISFLLDYEKIEDVDTDSDASSSDDESKPQMPVVLNKEAVYKALHKGTAASKRKKKAKLERALRNMKRQQRTSSENSNSTHYLPLNHLIDAQGFAEKLFSRLQTCNERFEIRMMMLKVLARTVGLHRLILLNLYPYLQRYVQPHQRDITSLLAAAIQACHDMVPPDAVEPLFKQIVNQFVHDGSRPEAIAVGLNVTREICLRMPLLMTEDLLQDLVLYKKSHEKAVSVAARSLMTLFREICPSLLVKKDRGRPSNPKAMPKAYGEVNVISNVPGLELLKQDIEEEEDEEGEDFGDIDDSASSGSEDDNDNEATASSDDEENQMHSDDAEENSDLQDDSDVGVDDADDYDTSDAGDDEENEEVEAEKEDDKGEADEEDQEEQEMANSHGTNDNNSRSKPSKRKFSVFNEKIISAETSLRALKRLAEEKSKDASTESADGILSNEDFRRIKELKAKEAAKFALSQQGFKLPSYDGLSAKRVDPAKLEVHVRKRLSKEEKLAIVKAGREETGQYRSRTSIKKKKTGGLSNREKEHKKQKRMPSAAIKSKIVKSRLDKKKKQQRSGKQFRGRKAWK